MTSNYDELNVNIKKCQKLAAQVDVDVQLKYFATEADYKRSLKLFFRDLNKDGSHFYDMTYPFMGSYLLDPRNFTKIVAVIPEFVPSLIRTGVDRIITYTSFRRLKNKGLIHLDTKSDRFVSEIILEAWDLIFKSGNTFPIEAEYREKIISTLKKSVITKSHYDILGCFQAVYNSLIIYLGLDKNINTRGMITTDHKDQEKRTLLYELVGPIAKPIHILNSVSFETVSYSELEESIRHAYSDQNILPTPPPKEIEDADFVVIQEMEVEDRISESQINYSKPPSIADYDTVALDLSEDPIVFNKFYFRLENSSKKAEPTDWVELQITDATFMYFLSLNRLDDSSDECQSVHAELQTEKLKFIYDKFAILLKGSVKKELQGEANKSRHSWVFGSAGTKSKYVERIHKSFTKATNISKQTGHRFGPLRFSCENEKEGGGFHLAPHITKIIHKKPPK